jgi:hypothetical protein
MSTVLETLFDPANGVLGLSGDPHNPTSASNFSLPKTDYKERYNSAAREVPSFVVPSLWHLDKMATPVVCLPDDVAVLRSPDYKKDTDAFRVMQKWQGHVLEICGDVFLARLHDLTGSKMPEDVELFTNDVSKHDRALLRPGAVFYWKIGYLDHLDGQRIRASIIRFRRRPVWTEEDAFLTAPPASLSKKQRRDSTVERTIRETVRHMATTPFSKGIVRVRFNPQTGTAPTIETFNGAVSLQTAFP